MPRWTHATSLGFALFMVSQFCLEGSPVMGQKLLRWNLQRNETIQVLLSQKMMTAASIQGTELRSTVDMLMAMKWHVLAVDAHGTAQMSQSIDRMKMTMESPGFETVAYDSATATHATGPTQSIAASIEPLLGVKFIQTMNDRGEIVDLRLSKEAAEALDKVPSGAQLKEMFSQEGLKSLVTQAAAVLPEKPIRPGDTWRGQSETKSPAGNLKMNMRYRYFGTELRQGRPVEKIGVALQLSFVDGANPLGLSVQIKDQDNSGTLYFDSVLGQFVETSLHQNMTLQTKLGNQTHMQKLDMQLRMQFRSDRSAQTVRSTVPKQRTARAPKRTAPR